MADTTFTNGTTVVDATWLNDINDHVYTGKQFDGFNIYVKDPTFGAIGDGSDETSKVQLALNSLTSSGGLIYINRGVKFNLTSLTFPIRANLAYWMDDDLSRPNALTTLETNEMVFFAANANPNGIVNEWRYTSSFHPGIGIDVRKDVPGHDARLGPGQARIPTNSISAKASFNIWDEQYGVYYLLYEVFGGDYSRFNTVSHHIWRNTFVLNGIGTNAGGWLSTPAAGTLVTASPSGAKGWVQSVSATSTTVLWLSGKFAVGDTLTDNNETTVNTITSSPGNVQKGQVLQQNLFTGAWSIGAWPLLPVGTLTVGGKIVAMPTKSVGQYIYSTVTSPAFVLTDENNYESSNGFEITYDTTVAAASRRITLRALNQSTNKAHVGAIVAHGTFSDALGIATSAYNISSITKNGTGDYTVNFTTPVVRADFATNLTVESPTIYAYVFAYGTSSVRIKVVSTTNFTTATNLTGQCHIICSGGDI